MDAPAEMDPSWDFDAFRVSFPADVELAFRTAYGAQHWDEMKRSLATPPAYTAVRVNTSRLQPHEALAALEASALRAFNAQLAAESGRPPVAARPHPLLPDVLVIPSAPRRERPRVAFRPELRSVVVDRLCGEAVLRGSDVFARGVMSASSGLSAGERVNVFVDLDHAQTRGSSFADHSARKLLIAHGTTAMARAELFRAQRGLAVTALARVVADAPPMNGVLPGDIYVQNLPSTVVAHVLGARPGETVMDMCAAPGGKASHLATLMQGRGTLVACDHSRRKALALRALFDQLSLGHAVALKMDSAHSVLPRAEAERRPGADATSVAAVLAAARAAQAPDAPLLPVRGFHAETFDRVLLDPPCSALGLRPRLLHAEDARALDKYARTQRNLLWAAVLLLKPGGTLVYSTCTINPAENERMVRHALDAYPLALAPQEVRIGSPGLADQGLSPAEAALVQRFDPADRALDAMGFFCAKFVKTRSSRDADAQA